MTMERDDAISRQAVNELVDELARAISDERCCISRGRSAATIMRDIMHLPPVTSHQRTGRWIEDLSDYDNKYPKHIQALWKCVECEKKQLRKSNYCPNCGAKMTEEAK